MTTPKRTLGQHGPAISTIGLGCMGMSEFYGEANDARSIALIHQALDMGVNFFDTADMYGPFTNERLLGRALKDRRDEAVIATKFAILRTEEGGFGGICGKPEYVKKSCDDSLQRLGVDTIDLYYQHRVDPTVPIEETVGAMADLVKAGKVRHLGLSEATPDQIRRAHGVHPISALQTEYSLWSREPEDAILSTCQALGITFVAYSPLGRGFLTGQIKSLDDLDANDYRRTSPRFMGENFAANLAVVEAVGAVAADKGCTPAQLALAWVIAQGEHIVSIPGTTKAHRLEENVAAGLIDLTPDDLARINAVLPRGVAAGDRY